MNYEIGIEQFACDRHIQPLLYRWPRGLSHFSRLMMGELGMARRALGLPETARGVMEALTYQPLCCRLPKHRLFGCYSMAHDGEPFAVAGKCDLCETVAPGAKMQSLNGGTLLREWSHLCMKCFYFDIDLAVASGLTVGKDPWGWWDDSVSPRPVL